jgi:hypothetical protein
MPVSAKERLAQYEKDSLYKEFSEEAEVMIEEFLESDSSNPFPKHIEIKIESSKLNSNNILDIKNDVLERIEYIYSENGFEVMDIESDTATGGRCMTFAFDLDIK